MNTPLLPLSVSTALSRSYSHSTSTTTTTTAAAAAATTTTTTSTPTTHAQQHHQHHRQQKQKQSHSHSHSHSSHHPHPPPSLQRSPEQDAPSPEAPVSTGPSQTHRHAQPPVARRSTLTSRFPLLRKSSREPAHARGSSISLSHIPQAPVQQPLLTTQPPRVSTSSSRGRLDAYAHEPPSREPSASPSIASSRDPDSASDSTRPAPSTASTPTLSSDSESTGKLDKLRHSVKAAKPGDKKMHQTSSRLLRMTDDERPFSRVSASFSLPATTTRYRHARRRRFLAPITLVVSYAHRLLLPPAPPPWETHSPHAISCKRGDATMCNTHACGILHSFALVSHASFITCYAGDDLVIPWFSCMCTFL